MSFLAALNFLTILPVPLRRAVSPEELGRSLGYFPVVGIIIGLILIGLNWLLSLILPSAVVNVLLIVSLTVLSGALHLDGLADTCDGIGGHKTPEERWRVMRDSRVGSFGVIGVCLMLLAKYISLNNVVEPLLIMTLLLMPVVSRWAMVYAVFAYPYARPSGLGKVFKQGATWQRLVMATLIALAVAMFLAGLAGLVMMASTWVIVMLTAAYLKRKFYGLTGDTYGAINEVSEVCIIILILILANFGLVEWGGIPCLDYSW